MCCFLQTYEYFEFKTIRKFMFYNIRFSCCFWLDPKVLFFCLDAKEPKNQGFVCFATRSLHFAVRIANSLRSNSDAPGRSVPVVRLTLTSRGQSLSPSPSALGSFFLSPEDSSPVLRGAGSRSETEGLRYLPHHNISCVHWRRKILRLYNHPA